MDDFRRFFCHLYFVQHYNTIPFSVTADVDMIVQPPPAISLEWPSFKSCSSSKDASCSILPNHDTAAPAMYEAVMSLCHYFDCARVLCRAEDNMLLVVGAAVGGNNLLVDRNNVWPCIRLAVQFDLKRVRAACIPWLATCSDDAKCKEEWERARVYLNMDTLFEVLQANFVAGQV